MAVYEGVIRNVTLDLLLYRLAGNFLSELWPYTAGKQLEVMSEARVYPVEFTFGDPPESFSEGRRHVDTSRYRDDPWLIERVRATYAKPQNSWSGTINQFTATPRYTAWWSFTGGDGRGEGNLFFDQWQTNEVQLYGWTHIWTNETFTVLDNLVTWLSEHYDHDVTRLELTPEQERQINNAKSEDDRAWVVREASYTYWKEIVQQAKASGNVRLYLNERDIRRTTYYRNKQKYRL